MGSDLNGAGSHIGEKVKSRAEILDMSHSQLEMTVFQAKQNLTERPAVFFIKPKHVIRIFCNDLKSVEFTWKLRLAAISMKFKRKCQKGLISRVCKVLQLAAVFHLGISLSFNHTVDLNDVGVIMQRGRRRGSGEIPVGEVPQGRDVMLVFRYGFILFGPGKMVKYFVHRYAHFPMRSELSPFNVIIPYIFGYYK